MNIKDYLLIFACEIDSNVRTKSYIKLNNINAEHKCWFYYGNEKERFNRADKKYNNSKSIKTITIL